jgi:hypothetical protein
MMDWKEQQEQERLEHHDMMRSRRERDAECRFDEELGNHCGCGGTWELVCTSPSKIVYWCSQCGAVKVNTGGRCYARKPTGL